MTALVAQLRERAAAEGFDDLRIASASAAPRDGERLRAFIASGFHGDMGWIAETAERRAAPTAMWPAARSAIVMAMSYAPDFDPLARLTQRGAGVISAYALGRDYHELIKGKLKRLAQWLAHESGAAVKVFVDTAPLMEKPLAQRAGLGWQGKHSNLVSRRLGSWFFIATILTDAMLEVDEAEADRCGSCQACLDICPTQAFPAPYRLDARRCISYLTIEHKGHIAVEFRTAMGNRIFGCDDCLAVCPWNKFAVAAREAKLATRADLIAPTLSNLLRLDDASFRALFMASPVKRLGRDRFLRNVLIAAGNSDDAGLLPDVEPLLRDDSVLVRAMAVWALGRLGSWERFHRLKALMLARENNADVCVEWHRV